MRSGVMMWLTREAEIGLPPLPGKRAIIVLNAKIADLSITLSG